MSLKFKIAFFVSLLLGLAYFTTSFIADAKLQVGTEKVLDVLSAMGNEKPLHYIPLNQLDSIKIVEGRNLVTQGYLNPDDKKLFETRQSKHFVCTDCHNIQREDPDLTKSDPEARLKYVSEKGIKFLPATTLYGTVNKKHWYNDDYLKKYGDLVVPARDTLENAVQLCAVVCSQGRPLTDTEMESVMHFLNSIGYSMDELNISEANKKKIVNSQENKEEAIALIESKYLDYSPATFMEPQLAETRKLGAKGNPFKGKKIYELSCMTCHQEGGVTNYKLSDEQLTFKHLKYWSGTHKVFSVYDITRKGTYSKNGYKPYMPNYTKERMSDQQLEDLMAYINEMAENGKITRTIGTPSF